MLLHLPIALDGQSSQEVFDQANAAYEGDEYKKAIELYESIIEEKTISSSLLYYNLANAYLQEDRLGDAILFYERALTLNPGEKDYKANLAIARDLCQDDFSTIPDFFLKKWILSTVAFFRSSTWAILSVVFIFLGVGSLIGWLFLNELSLKKLSFGLGILFMGFCLLSLILGQLKKARELDNPSAIVMESSVSFRIAPDEKSKTLFPIHEGLKVKIVDQIGDWVKVELSNKELGWIESSAVEKI